MADGDELPPKVYRKLFQSIYIQNKKDAKLIKDNWSRNGNPIIQKENRYFSPRTKGNNLTQEYIKRMAEKPEKAHIKRIPKESNLSSGPIVKKESKTKPSIRLNPKIRKNQSSISAPKIDNNHKHISKNNYYKFFYLDNFNSVKQNQYDIDNKNKVSTYFIFIYKNYYIQKNHHNKKNEENFSHSLVQSKSQVFENPNGFKRPVIDTKENIFPSDKPKNPIKVKRNEKILKRKKIYTKYYEDNVGGIISPKANSGIEKKLPSKPCNNDYNVVTNEARKNAHVRYYFENNVSQWGYS